MNRSATASSKKGGRSTRRNQSVHLFDDTKPIDSDTNQDAFLKNTSEAQARNRDASAGQGKEPQFLVRISSLGSGRTLPRRHAADLGNISPPVEWSGLSTAARELVLVLEEVGPTPFVHWLVYRIMTETNSLPEGIPPFERVEALPGAIQGRNSTSSLGYYGPFPPLFDDWHHYKLRLIALESVLQDVRPGMTKEELFDRMKDCILDEAAITLRYKRPIPGVG